MVLLKWGFWSMFWALLALMLHYTLPQHDIARVTDTYEKRIDFGENSIFWAAPDVGSDTTMANRDVFFIQTVRPDGDVMVYRNEDTGWGWPPYFKFDTSNLQAEAADLRSTVEAPTWVAIRHYGWRNEFMSIFPNAVGIRPVNGPEARLGVPWLNLFIILMIIVTAGGLWWLWRSFRARRIDPIVDTIEEGWDAAGDAVEDRRGRLKRWLDTWKPKHKR